MNKLKYEGVAALSIVSKNYISLARVLAKSFIDNHPGSRFFVVLVDKNDGYIRPEEECFELFEMTDVDLPNPEIFPYQYNILELNTAVKPFALRWIFNTQPDINKIAYIDPDIRVYDELIEVWEGLEKNSVTLTPHMREPFDDGHSPTELNILQSGTYNLGFIGLKRDEEGLKLLDWWCERLYLNCVVDIPKGLFTDQKWIDLVPGYFKSTKIIHNPAYNIAYWNLHERELEIADGKFKVEGDNLRFFHFSGYDPRKKEVLSKHQSRHNFVDLPVIKEIYDEYAEALFKADIVETKAWPFAYEKLRNGIKLNNAIHRVIRKCLEDNIAFPCPTHETEEFCRFLCTPNRKVFGQYISPLVSGILQIRPDVETAFPRAASNLNDEGFISWLKNNGSSELELNELLITYGHLLSKKNPIQRLTEIYFEREDVQAVYPEAFKDQAAIDNIAKCWYITSAVAEYQDVESADIERLTSLHNSTYKILSLYFSREDLQKTFHNIFSVSGLVEYTNWLLDNIKSFRTISEDDIYLFNAWAKCNTQVLLRCCLTYNKSIRDLCNGIPTIFNIEKICNYLFTTKASYEKSEIEDWLLNDHSWVLIEQLAAFAKQDITLAKLISSTKPNKAELIDVLNHPKVKQIADRYNIFDRLNDEINCYQLDKPITNVAGYFNAATGMGQSARSMEVTLKRQAVACQKYILPEIYIDDEILNIAKNGFVFGLPSPFAENNITIANADAVPSVQSLLPNEFFSGVRIGYWVWETEELPARWKDSADFYEEIWSASIYSAKAIENTIAMPVKVVPHELDPSDFRLTRTKRSEFKLPKNKFICGYFFDQKSINERKNPKAVIDAFRLAFENNNNAVLLLKVNTPSVGEYSYSRLKSYAKGLSVIWMEQTLNREKTLALMSCLDCYISLHRSEGYGLTMAEALHLGIPVVATGYSGNVDFMNCENSYLVEYDRVKTKKTNGAYPKGTIWANPDIRSAASQLQNIHSVYLKKSKLLNFIFS